VVLLVLPWCHPSILQQLSNWKPVITLKTLNPKPPGLCMVSISRGSFKRLLINFFNF
jgi:hypothetical protein